MTATFLPVRARPPAGTRNPAEGDPRVPLSQRVVERLARRLDHEGGASTFGGVHTQKSRHPPRDHQPAPHPAHDDGDGTTRRSFLARSAVVGSALAVAPARFLLRPGSAYAAVTGLCGPDANCQPGGFSVFCCTINNGVNKCPPGSIPGGWWRAGIGSSWCCGGDRYYVDCQASCPPGCGCDASHLCPGCQACTAGCYQGPSCDQRNVCQVRFRYGQCNQQIGCTGNVLCRMVSCTPPWLIPGLNCSSGPDKTHPATAEHSAPCLQQPSWTTGAAPVTAGVITQSPSVAQVPGSSRVDLFAAGGDGQVHWATNEGGGWTGLRSVGAPPVGFNGWPAAVSWGAGNLNVFLWGRDNHLWQRYSGDGGQSWSPWGKPLGNDGLLASVPAVSSWGPGHIDVFVVGGDGGVYHRWFDQSWNGGWESRGAPPQSIQFSALSASSWAPGRLDVFATSGGQLWQTFYDRGWRGWFQPDNSAGASLVSAPASASWGPGHVAVFGRGPDARLYWTNYFQGVWSGWAPAGARSDTFTGGPAAGSPGCQQLRVFARGPFGHVREYVYSS